MDKTKNNQHIIPLPLPSQDKSGWPWLENSELNVPVLPVDKTWPQISIVTPSLNQAHFLEETIRSVLLQGYPNLEFIIIDGGSTDGSVEIIKKYEPWLTYWSSEPDSGQTNAINKGFSRVSGDWFAWINSDDYYLSGTLFRVASTMLDNPCVDWIVGTTKIVDSGHNVLDRSVPKSSKDWTDYVCVRQSGVSLPQPSSFWSRKAWLNAGILDESFHYAMDFEYWVRLAKSGIYPLCINEELSAFRLNEGAKTSEGILPFWREEMRVVEQCLLTATPIEKMILLECKEYLERGIKRVKRELKLNTIGRFLLRPFQ